MKDLFSTEVKILSNLAEISNPKQKRFPRRTGLKNLSDRQKAAKIRELHRTTDLPQHAIASLFGYNQGQVSKILHNKIFPDYGTTH